MDENRGAEFGGAREEREQLGSVQVPGVDMATDLHTTQTEFPDATFEFGGAVGLGGSLFGLGVFIEAGLLPQNQSGELVWIAEARAGVYYVFD